MFYVLFFSRVKSPLFPQDTFLPCVEDGTIVLLGATTENPSFQLNSALLSRCRVVVLEKLSVEEVRVILTRAAEEVGVGVVESGTEGQDRYVWYIND